MGLRFDREIEVVIGPVKLAASAAGAEGLSFNFNISRSITIEPNTCELEIFNLSADTRNKIPQISDFVNRIGKIVIPEFRRGSSVEVLAGYDGELTRIFKGNLRRASIQRQGPSTVLRLSSGDFGGEARVSRVNKTFAKGTSIADIAKALIKTLPDLGEGNLLSQIKNFVLPSGKLTPRATTMSGNPLQELDAMIKAAGGEVSIQNGILQVTQRGEPSGTTVTVLSAATGLLGTPTVDNLGVLTAKSLLQPGLSPGKLARIEGEFITGRFRIVKANYIGGSRTPDYSVNITGWAY